MTAPSAEQLAQALIATSDRYMQGCMARATFKNHMAALWGRVAHAGLRYKVLNILNEEAQCGIDRAELNVTRSARAAAAAAPRAD